TVRSSAFRRPTYPRLKAELQTIAEPKMYLYRTMTPEEQKAVVQERIKRGFPWHGPPHPDAPGQYRIVSGTCYEHAPAFNSPARLKWFEVELLGVVKGLSCDCAAWCVLPNHYHILVRIMDMPTFSAAFGELHGRTSFQMNGEDNMRGRKVWHRFQDRCMRSDRHFYTSLNYIHNNPVKHGYVIKWQHWPFSSVHWYLENKGRSWLL